MAEGLFPVGTPAGADDVVDREHFLDDVALRLRERQSIVLAGPRRTGKTSAAHAVLRRLSSDGRVHTASVDLAAVASLDELADRLMVGAVAALSPPARAARTAKETLAGLLRVPEVRARLHDLEVSVHLLPEADRHRDALRRLDEAVDLPERIAERSGRPFVVLLDEFQSIPMAAPPGTLARLRSAFQLQRHTAYLFLGSSAGMMARLFGAGNQPFFRYAALLELPPVPADAWAAYIRTRLATRGVTIDEAAIGVLLEATGGHPYDTMRTAFEAYVLAAGASRIGPGLVGEAAAAVQAQLAVVFEAEIDAAGPRARALLARVAKDEPLYAGTAAKGATASALRALCRDGLLVRRGRGRYALVEPMLARHLGG